MLILVVYLKFFFNGAGSDNYILGNVGIGTASPGAKTHIYSGASGQGSAHANGDELILENNGIVGMTFLAPSANSAQILFGNPTSSARGIIMYDNSNDKMSFGTTTAVADMVIDTSGNVGIGTTGPNSILEVSNDTAEIIVNRQGNWASGTAGIKFATNNAVTDYWTLGMQPLTNNHFYLKKNAATYLTVLDTGNVGIGTNSPSQKLHVTGNARVTGAYYDSNNSPGTANQVLISTVTGTDWIDGSAIPGVPAGSGTLNTVAMWTPDGDTLGNSPITISGNDIISSGRGVIENTTAT